MDNLTKDMLRRCNFCDDRGLVNSLEMESHLFQNHNHQLFHCLVCSSLGHQRIGFDNFVDAAKHVVEELKLDSTDRREICKKILCPGDPKDLKVFRCLLCPYEGMAFVGLPEDVFMKHVANNHGEDAAHQNPHKLVWECRVCRGLLVDDVDLTRHILKRHGVKSRIFNHFPFGAFVFKAPVSQTFSNVELYEVAKLEVNSLLEDLKVGLNYQTKFCNLGEGAITNMNDEDITQKLDNNYAKGSTKPEKVNNGNNNVTQVFDLEDDNITELSYSETDETKFRKMGSDESDLWGEINERFENVTESRNTLENESKEPVQRNNNNIANEDVTNKSSTNALKDTSFLCAHCPDAFTHIESVQVHLHDVHKKDDFGVDLLEKGELKPPRLLVEVVCRFCQPAHRVIATSCTQLYLRVVDHMEKHRDVWGDVEGRVGYGCRVCVHRTWDDLSQVLGHVDRRHKRKRTSSRDSPSMSKSKLNKESPRDEPNPEDKTSSTSEKYDKKNKNERKCRKISNFKKYEHDQQFYSVRNSKKSDESKKEFKVIRNGREKSSGSKCANNIKDMKRSSHGKNYFNYTPFSSSSNSKRENNSRERHGRVSLKYNKTFPNSSGSRSYKETKFCKT